MYIFTKLILKQHMLQFVFHNISHTFFSHFFAPCTRDYTEHNSVLWLMNDGQQKNLMEMVFFHQKQEKALYFTFITR